MREVSDIKGSVVNSILKVAFPEDLLQKVSLVLTIYYNSQESPI